MGIVHKPFSTFPYPGCERTYIGVPESGLFALDSYIDSSGQRIIKKPTYLPPFENER